MPTLQELSTDTGLRKFKESVVVYSREIENSNTAMNSGIESSEDIEEMYQRGDNMDYDYSRIISDANSYT